MRFRPSLLDRDDRAMSSAITIMFMLAIFASIYSTIIGLYIPEWAEVEEKKQMRNMEKTFVEMAGGLGLMMDYGYEGSSLTYPIDMGTRVEVESMQVLETASAAGTIGMNRSKNVTSMSVYDNTTGARDIISSSYGHFNFKAYNTYYPSQVLRYENTAVLRSQDEDQGFTILEPELSLYVSRETLNQNTNDEFLWDGTTGAEYARSVTFLVPGRPGDLNISYEEWAVSPQEVEVYLNGEATGIYLQENTSGSWSHDVYLNIPDRDLYDGGINNITFVNLNNQAPPPYPDTWGVRNVSIRTDYVQLTLPSIIFEGKERTVGGVGTTTVTFTLMAKNHLIFRQGGEGGNYSVDITSDFVNAWHDSLVEMFEASSLADDEYDIRSLDDNTVRLEAVGVDELVINKALFEVEIGT